MLKAFFGIMKEMVSILGRADVVLAVGMLFGVNSVQSI